MLRLLGLVWFIHFQLIGQTQDMLDYNDSRNKLYKCLNLEPFQDSKMDFHLRLNIEYSVIVDIWKDENEMKGGVYQYIYQEEKQNLNREFEETKTYLHKKDTLNDKSIDRIMHCVDSIMTLDSIDIHPMSKFNCGVIQPIVFIEKKNAEEFQWKKTHESHIKSILEDTKIQRLNTDVWPYGIYFGIGGSAMTMHHINPVRIMFSGVSCQYSTRKEQNRALFTYF